MVHYEYRGRLLGTVVWWGLGGILSGLVIGFLTVSVWKNFLEGNLGWSGGEVLLFSLGMVVPCLLLLAGCTRSTAIISQEKGLAVRTCFFFWFFVHWEDIVDLWSYSSSSITARRSVQQTFVPIKRGLTPLHRGFYKGATGLRWSRGLTITSEAQGYSDLVRAIEKHTGLKAP